MNRGYATHSTRDSLLCQGRDPIATPLQPLEHDVVPQTQRTQPFLVDPRAISGVAELETRELKRRRIMNVGD
jgi:hypothetical protein